MYGHTGGWPNVIKSLLSVQCGVPYVATGAQINPTGLCPHKGYVPAGTYFYPNQGYAGILLSIKGGGAICNPVVMWGMEDFRAGCGPFAGTVLNHVQAVFKFMLSRVVGLHHYIFTSCPVTIFSG